MTAITLTDGTTTIDLNPDLYWPDEFTWRPVEQTVDESITGALIIQPGTRLAGRNITLQPEDASSAWMTRDVVDALGNFAAVAGKTMTLTLRGVPYTVIFRHQESSGAMETTPIQHQSDVQGEDYYLVTLRFMEVEA